MESLRVKIAEKLDEYSEYINNQDPFAPWITVLEQLGYNAEICTVPISGVIDNETNCLIAFKDRFVGYVEFREGELFLYRKGHCTKISQEQLVSAYTGNALKITRKRAGIHWLRSIFAVYKPELKQVILASLLLNILGLASPLFIMNVYDRVIPNQAFNTLWILFVGMIIVLFFEFLIRIAKSFFLEIAGNGMDFVISRKIFNHLQNAKLHGTNASPVTIVSEFKILENLREYVTSFMLSTLTDFPFVIITIGVIFWVGGSLGLVPLVTLLLILSTTYLFQRLSVASTQQTWNQQIARNRHLVETLTKFLTIKSLSAERFRQNKWEHFVLEDIHNKERSRFFVNVSSALSRTLQQMAVVTLVVLGVYAVVNQQLSVGGLIACSILSSRVFIPLNQLASLLMRLQQAKKAYASLTNFFKGDTEKEYLSGIVNLENITGDLRVQNVIYVYPSTKIRALNNISFEIKRGEHINIIGANSSGKTTLSELLINLKQPSAGKILLDDIDVNLINPKILRRYISYVPQRGELFYGTVRDNFLIANPYATDEDIIRVCSKLDLTHIFNNNPAGLDRPFTEKDESLSEGELHRFAMARAFLRKSAILILDEPSRELDTAAGLSTLKKALDWYTQETNCTVIVISRDLNIAHLCPRTIFLEKGQVAIDDPTKEVVKKLVHGQQ